jgi:hypothetical protein
MSELDIQLVAIQRLRLTVAQNSLEYYLKHDGKRDVTHNGASMAVKNVIEPVTGKTYKRSKKGKQEALADCIELLRAGKQ